MDDPDWKIQLGACTGIFREYLRLVEFTETQREIEQLRDQVQVLLAEREKRQLASARKMVKSKVIEPTAGKE